MEIKFKTKLIKFLRRHTIVTKEALGTYVNDLSRVDAQQCGDWELSS